MRLTLLVGLQRLETLVKLSLSIFTSKNNSSTLLGACSPLDTMPLPFSGNFITKYSLLVSLKQLKMFVIPFSLSFSLQKRKPNLSSCLNTSKYINRTLLYAFQPLKTSRIHGLLHFNLERYHMQCAFWFLTTQYLIYGLF